MNHLISYKSTIFISKYRDTLRNENLTLQNYELIKSQVARAFKSAFF